MKSAEELVGEKDGMTLLRNDHSSIELIKQIQLEAWHDGMSDAADLMQQESRQDIEHGVFSSHHRCAYETGAVRILTTRDERKEV